MFVGILDEYLVYGMLLIMLCAKNRVTKQ